jgi:C-methyltransferase
VSTDAREPATLQTIADMDVGALRAAVLEAALQLDVFTLLGPGCMSLTKLVGATSADPRALAILFDALCGLGLLTKSDDRYGLDDAAKRFLARGGEAFRGEVVLRMFAARRQLADVVRNGRSIGDLTALTSGDFWAQFASPRLVVWPEEVEEELATWRELGVTPERRPGVRVLDIACGAGIRTFGLAREDPQARIVAIDSAPVLEVARKIAERMGVTERVDFRPGEISAADLGSEEFDLTLLSYLLYFFTPEAAVGLLERVWRALKPGGRVVVRAAIPDEERCTATDALLDAVDLLLWIPDSRVYTYVEYRDLLTRAGFVDIARHGEQVITAARPGQVPA